MKAVIFILFTTVLFSCNNASEQQEGKATVETETALNKAEPVSAEQCYFFVAVKDTYALRLNIIDTAVKGNAIFKNFEKDSSHGTVEGEIKGDMIHLWYSFQSEGMRSVRELYFKKEGNQLVTGISNEASRGDTAYVPDAGAIKYTGPVYSAGDCANVPAL